jgi:hypothetical protein
MAGESVSGQQELVTDTRILMTRRKTINGTLAAFLEHLALALFVAATVANIPGIAMKKIGFPLEPEVMRKLLTDTGLPQEGPDIDKRIGPHVNLRNAIDKMLDGTITAKPTAPPITHKLTATPTTPNPTATPTTPTATKAGKSQGQK